MCSIKYKITFIICCIFFLIRLNIYAYSHTSEHTSELIKDTIDPHLIINNYIQKKSIDNINLKDFSTLIQYSIENNLINIDDFFYTDNFFELIEKYNLNINCINNLIQLDSILNITIIPQRFIKHFTNYLFEKINSEKCNLLTYDCEFPASDIYNNIWNTRNSNPYPSYFADLDTLLTLRLVNDESDFHKPGDGWISSRYGWRNNGWHGGIDLAVYHWEPIYAVFPGVVRLARTYGGYGRLIIIRHDNGLETYYAHLSRINVKPGQRVMAGDIIGASGNSGRSRGTHLHFEIRYKGLTMNPAHLICFRENKLMHNEIILKKQNNNYYVYTEDAILYKVQRGDYLYRIAQEFGTSIDRICQANGISRRSILRVGQVLRIYM